MKEALSAQSNGVDVKMEDADGDGTEPAAAANTNGAAADGASDGKVEAEEKATPAGKAPAKEKKGVAAKKAAAAKQEQLPARVTRRRVRQPVFWLLFVLRQ